MTPRWCSNCLSMSTRPRITFDADGVCNACRWSVRKSSLRWDVRSDQLTELLDRHRRHGGTFDCIVPVSGGKDGSYVAHSLRQRGMNPLCVTVTPPLPLALGDRNLRSFVEAGFNHISVNVAYEAMRTLNRHGLTEMGFPYYGWLIAIMSAVIRVAKAFDVGLIFYGEDGEVEYGGSEETARSPVYGVDYMKRVYLEGGHARVLAASGLQSRDLTWFQFPEAEGLDITHWSYFEPWDPYRNYLVAKEHCGLAEAAESNAGTFTNFAQNDQALYALHVYIMYLKFGFGRANQDACIEIRRGALTRAQALELVRLYDGHYPMEFEDLYLDYYRMSREDFHAAVGKWANRELFEHVGGRWVPRFEVV